MYTEMWPSGGSMWTKWPSSGLNLVSPALHNYTTCLTSVLILCSRESTFMERVLAWFKVICEGNNEISKPRFQPGTSEMQKTWLSCLVSKFHVNAYIILDEKCEVNQGDSTIRTCKNISCILVRTTHNKLQWHLSQHVNVLEKGITKHNTTHEIVLLLFLFNSEHGVWGDMWFTVSGQKLRKNSFVHCVVYVYFLQAAGLCLWKFVSYYFAVI